MREKLIRRCFPVGKFGSYSEFGAPHSLGNRGNRDSGFPAASVRGGNDGRLLLQSGVGRIQSGRTTGAFVVAESAVDVRLPLGQRQHRDSGGGRATSRRARPVFRHVLLDSAVRRRQVPEADPGRRHAGAERLRLVADPDAGAVVGRRRREATAAHQTTDERVHGLGSGSASQARGPVPATAQRRAQQNARKTLEVSYTD